MNAPVLLTTIDPNAVTPIKGLATVILNAGVSVKVSSELSIGGYIINPQTKEDQNLPSTYPLYVSPVGPASTVENETTSAIQPGGRYNIISGSNTWVNSIAPGHRFIAVLFVPQIIPPNLRPPAAPVPGQGVFPIFNLTGLLSPIPSYLYQEYSDDSDLQAFVAAQNSMMQDIIDTFNGLNLPIYIQDPISGALLDWVGQGVYGIPRPSLSSGEYSTLGPYNTGEYNTQEYNFWKLLYPDQIVNTNDDIYRRVITWHFFKGDGKYFTVQWLKRRIMRFLFGVNGTNFNPDNAYQISITFGPNSGATIRIVLGNRTITSGARYDDQSFTYNSLMYDEIHTEYVAYPPLPNMAQFAEAVNSGVLELPFQFKWDVVIG